MATLVYLLCALTAFGCTLLLSRAFSRSGSRLLFWSAICFACFTVNNALIAVDLVVLPEVDLSTLRLLVTLLGNALLLGSLISESR